MPIAVVISSLWLGILTSISPCPLATNIAAISFVSRKANKTNFILITGLLYALGRMLAYAMLGVLVTTSILSLHEISFFLQKYMYMVLGPLLIIVGMFLLELLNFSLPSFPNSQKLQKKLEHSGTLGIIGLGFIFALAFCPVSAALYFGSLIPLAVKYSSPVTLPVIYGFGSAIPVLVFAIALISGSRAAARLFNQVTAIEKWLRISTGVLIISIGIYFCLTYIFHLL